MTRALVEMARRRALNNWGILNSESIFRGCVTINPMEVEEAWDQLSVDTRQIELAEIPLVLHSALIATLEMRSHEQRER